jgi:hypothetical protein
MNEEYVEPEIEPYTPKEHLKSALMDPQARDQFVMYRGDDVSIFWNRKTDSPEHVYSRTVSKNKPRERKRVVLIDSCLVELDRDICPMVSQGFLSLYIPYSRYCSLGWPIMEQDCSICSSRCQVDRLFSQRTLSRNLV